MNNITQDVKDFPIWAKETAQKYPDILENMLKSNDILTVVIAKRILAVGGSGKA